jgi:hypothetical protein
MFDFTAGSAKRSTDGRSDRRSQFEDALAALKEWADAG